VRSLLRSVLAEPRAPGAPARLRRDWVLVGLLMPTAVIEAALRADLPWRWPTLALTLLLIPTLLWRRTHPLVVVTLGFGSMLVLTVAQLVADVDETGLNTMAALLLGLYTLFRWGSGNDMLIGTAVVATTATVAVVANYTGVGDAIGGYAVLGITVAIALAVRFRGRARQRELEQVRSTEREHLARDLHDTVAHHVSAIAISAQAGLAVSPTRPDAAVEALRVIEAEASRTLAEMRAMVGVLRRDEPANLAPTPSLCDIRRLAGNGSAGPPVEVEIDDGLDSTAPAVASAVFRLAQESITNARRYARGATLIHVHVAGDADTIRLRVSDDGEPVDDHRNRGGYGIVGMIERADLLGGACVAGPGPARGWVVRADIPRYGAPS
jgi:signal transduction histidine kinase